MRLKRNGGCPADCDGAEPGIGCIHDEVAQGMAWSGFQMVGGGVSGLDRGRLCGFGAGGLAFTGWELHL